MQLRKEVPLELVVNMFRKLVCSFSLATSCCRLRHFVFPCVELAAHHVFAGRGAEGHDHKNGHRGPVNCALYPSRRSRRGKGYD